MKYFNTNSDRLAARKREDDLALEVVDAALTGLLPREPVDRSLGLLPRDRRFGSPIFCV